jgi:hypothetical protein
MLERSDHDPARRGPLLVVLPPRYPTIPMPPPRPVAARTLAAIAEAYGRRVMRAAGITTLAPATMTVINTHPSTPRPLADLSAYEAPKALLLTLDAAQWRKIAGEGIGVNDLNDDQQALFDSMMPQHPVVVTQRWGRVIEGPRGSGPVPVPTTENQEPVDRTRVRLHLFRHTRFSLFRSDKPGETMGDDADLRHRQSGITIQLTDSPEDWFERGQRQRAFGAALVTTAPNRLKPADLDYADPSLNVAVALDDLETIDGLLKRISAAVGWEFLADRRVGPLALFVRAEPGAAARAGDLLMALALNVTGAYRRLGEQTFLLTDDVEGIGTRFARLDEWAAPAIDERYRLLRRLTEQSSRLNAREYLRFAPGDPTAVPENMYRGIEAKWENADWSKGEVDLSYEVKASQLSATFQKEIQDEAKAKEQMQDPIPLRTDRVRLDVMLRADWVLPDGRTCPASGPESPFSLDSVFNLLPRPRKRTAASPPGLKPPVAARKSPLKLRRGALMVAAPESASEAERLAALVKDRGVSELWITSTPASSDIASLRTAVAAGRTAGIPVWAAVSLLRGSGIGEPDRNILGETGDVFARRAVAAARNRPDARENPEWADEITAVLAGCGGWYSAAPEQAGELAARLETVAATPGLAGIVLSDSGGPGHTGERRQILAIPMRGNMGYTLPARLAFLRTEGVDPLDIVNRSDISALHANDFTVGPFFPMVYPSKAPPAAGGQEPSMPFIFPWQRWESFLEERNRSLLGGLYAAFRKRHPALPLFIDDRGSTFAHARAAWFGSWDAAEKLPKNPWEDAKRCLAEARATSKMNLLVYRPKTSQGSAPSTPSFLAEWGATVEQAGVGWDGTVLDFRALTSAAVVRLLESLPRSTADHPAGR